MRDNDPFAAHGASHIVLLVLVAALLSPTLVAQSADPQAAKALLAQIERLEAAERYVDAIPLAEKYLTLHETLFGVEHSETAVARARVAEIYVSVGDFARAEAILGQGFAIHQKSLGVEATRGLLSGRAFLLRGYQEPPQYGLYSFLLFDAPPRDAAERLRYLKALDAYLLLLPPISELERHRLRRELNVTLNPVTKNVELPVDLVEEKARADTAGRILEVYDYAKAKALLDEIGKEVMRGGPYLIAALRSPQGTLATRLFLDMSHVAPQLVWDWTRLFCWLAARERSWSEVTLRRLVLNMRNAIAIAGKNTDEIVRLVMPVRH